MKVLHVGKYFFPDFGGMETVLRDVTKLGLRLGLTVSVHAFSSKLTKVYENRKLKVFLYKPYKIICSQPISFKYQLDLFKKLKCYDVVHLHSPNPLAEVTIWLGHFFYDFKLIVHYHCDVYRQKQIKRFYIPFRRRLLQSAECVIVSDKSLIPLAVRSGAQERAIVVIPFAASDIGKFNEAPGEYALFVGRLVSYKGLTLLVEAAKTLRMPLKIAGCGPQFEILSQMAVDCPWIELLGEVNEDKKKKLIEEARFGVLPSVNSSETFGLFILECLSQGKPMISTKLGTATDTVNLGGYTGYVVAPNDEVALRNAMAQLWGDRETLHKFSENAIRRVRTYYSTKIVETKYRSLYQDLGFLISDREKLGLTNVGNPSQHSHLS